MCGANNVQLSFNEILAFDVIRQRKFYFNPCRSFSDSLRIARSLDRNFKINCIKIAIDCACKFIKDREVNTQEQQKKPLLND